MRGSGSFVKLDEVNGARWKNPHLIRMIMMIIEAQNSDEDAQNSTQLISLAGAHMAGCWPENDCGEEDEYISRRLRQEETEQQD